jgi:predicted DNA-binding transcriptional regulator YafY
MNKSSTSYLFECYIWLVNTIARGPITRAAIDDKWARASVNDYKTDSIPECTFHRWRNNVELLFDVTIKCNTHGEYYIEDGNNLHSDDWRNRMFQLFAMNSLIKDSKELRHRILYEEVPSGEKFLSTVVEAMRDNCVLEMTYQGYAKTEPSTFKVEPYCLKMFKQRWYMLAYSPGTDDMRVYGLDRIHAIEPTTQKYKLPKGFNAEAYFSDAYGITMLDDQQEPQKIVISISENQAHYLRTLPLHSSQKEIEPINGYPTFSFYVYPSEEFCQELFKYGSDLEVHEPKSLRNYFAEDADRVNKMYNG